MKTRCELDAPGRQQTYSADMKEPPCEMYCRRTALNIRHLAGNCSVYVLQKIEIRKKLPAADREMRSSVFYLSKYPKCPIGLSARLEPCRGCSHQSWSPQTVAAKWRLSGFLEDSIQEAGKAPSPAAPTGRGGPRDRALADWLHHTRCIFHGPPSELTIDRWQELHRSAPVADDAFLMSFFPLALSLFDSVASLKCYSEYALPDSSFLFTVRYSQFSRWQRPHLSPFAPLSVCQQKSLLFI